MDDVDAFLREVNKAIEENPPVKTQGSSIIFTPPYSVSKYPYLIVKYDRIDKIPSLRLSWFFLCFAPPPQPLLCVFPMIRKQISAESDP
jgi:hypothetical protein